MKVLVICHGNINRSALAHYTLQRFAAEQRLELEVKSAAVKPDSGKKRAAKKMRDDAMAKWGISLEEHRSTEITNELAKWADEILFMDNGNLKRLCDRVGTHTQKFIPLGRFHPDDKGNYRIADPAFMKKGSPEWEKTLDQIRKACAGYVADLMTRTKKAT